MQIAPESRARMARGLLRLLTEVVRDIASAGARFDPALAWGLYVQAAFLVVVLLLIADLFTTSSASPNQWEANPVLRSVMPGRSLTSVIAAAKLADAACLATLHFMSQWLSLPRIAAFALTMNCIYYGVAVWGNYRG